MTIQRLKLKSNEERWDDYPYLRFFRNNEKISRVDKYSIILYWDDYNFKGDIIQLHQLLFYPSIFGKEEIEQSKNSSDTKYQFLNKKLNQLIKFGNCWWEYDVDYELTNENWRIDDLSKAKPVNKFKLKSRKTKRHKLKLSKPIKYKLS